MKGCRRQDRFVQGYVVCPRRSLLKHYVWQPRSCEIGSLVHNQQRWFCSCNNVLGVEEVVTA